MSHQVHEIIEKTPMGNKSCTMYRGDNPDQPGKRVHRFLEVTFPDPDSGEDNVYHVGLKFEGKKLVDYDGVYQLSKFSIKCIRSAGYTVPREFEP